MSPWQCLVSFTLAAHQQLYIHVFLLGELILHIHVVNIDDDIDLCHVHAKLPAHVQLCDEHVDVYDILLHTYEYTCQ